MVLKVMIIGRRQFFHFSASLSVCFFLLRDPNEAEEGKRSMAPTSSGGPGACSSSSSSSSLPTAAISLLLLSIGACAGSAAALSWRHLTVDRWRCDDERGSVADGVAGLVGHTPIVRIRSLSEATGCEVRAPERFEAIETAQREREESEKGRLQLRSFAALASYPSRDGLLPHRKSPPPPPSHPKYRSSPRPSSPTREGPSRTASPPRSSGKRRRRRPGAAWARREREPGRALRPRCGRAVSSLRAPRAPPGSLWRCSPLASACAPRSGCPTTPQRRSRRWCEGGRGERKKKGSKSLSVCNSQSTLRKPHCF